eukprot:14592243-Alexandrium_andersonii.AAC.1
MGSWKCEAPPLTCPDVCSSCQHSGMQVHRSRAYHSYPGLVRSRPRRDSRARLSAARACEDRRVCARACLGLVAAQSPRRTARLRGGPSRPGL